MIDAALLDELHDLLLACAPELRKSPLYVLAPPPSYPNATGVEAYTFRSIDYAIRRSLMERAKWTGPGNTIVVSRGDTDRETLFGLLLHEGAHCLPWSAPLADCDPTEQQIVHQADLVSRWANEPNDLSSTAPPWFPDHDWKFVRRVLHLVFRAEQIGFTIPLPALHCGGEQYGVSGLWKFKKALGDEPARMLAWNFTAIEEAKPPQEMIELWEADTARYRRSRTLNHDLEAA